MYIPFSSEQVKSADVVTYNDKGEAIPLSERFNPKTKDIRYAIKDIGNAEEALLRSQISMPKAQYDRRYRLAIKHNNDIIKNGDLPKLSYIIDGNYAYIYMNFDDYFTIDGDDSALIFVEKAKVGSHKYDNIIEEVNKYVRREGIVQAREQRGSFYRSDIRNSGSPKERGDNESAYTDVQGQPGTDGRGVPEESKGDILQPGRTSDTGGRGGIKLALSSENTNDSLNKLTDEYGAIETGENPARDIAVPKQTSKYKKVRRFTRTVLESGNITDEMVEPIKEQILEEAFSYVPITDEAARTSAESTIATLGTERAHRKWMSAIDSNKAPTKEDIALGEYLLVEAAKNSSGFKRSKKRILRLCYT